MLDFIAKEPGASKFFHAWLGSNEFLNGRPRYTLWLGETTPQELVDLPLCRERVENVRIFREKSSRAQTKKAAATPQRYGTEIITSSTSVLVPTSTTQIKCQPIYWQHTGRLMPQ